MFALPPDSLRQIERQVEEPPLAAAFALNGAANPHLNVFVVNFDGTGNDRGAVPGGEQATLIGRLDAHFNSESVRESLKSQGRLDSFCSVYCSGVFTDPDQPMGVRLLEGFSGRGVAARADLALARLVEFIKEREAADPNAVFHVHVNGYSRGCASGLIFMNAVRDMEKLRGQESRQGPYFENAGSWIRSSALMLDPVVTGVLSPAGEIGLSANSLQLPINTVSCLSLVAGGEERSLFPAHSLSNDLMPSEDLRAPGTASCRDLPPSTSTARLTQIVVPCVSHADIGSTFPQASSTAAVEYLAISHLSSLGLPIQGAKPSKAKLSNLTASHWGMFEMIDSATSGKWRQLDTWAEAMARKISSAYVDKINALERRLKIATRIHEGTPQSKSEVKRGKNVPKKVSMALPPLDEMRLTQRLAFRGTGIGALKLPEQWRASHESSTWETRPIKLQTDIVPSDAQTLYAADLSDGAWMRLQLEFRLDSESQHQTVSVSRGYRYDPKGLLRDKLGRAVDGAPSHQDMKDILLANRGAHPAIRMERYRQLALPAAKMAQRSTAVRDLQTHLDLAPTFSFPTGSMQRLPAADLASALRPIKVPGLAASRLSRAGAGLPAHLVRNEAPGFQDSLTSNRSPAVRRPGFTP